MFWKHIFFSVAFRFFNVFDTIIYSFLLIYAFGYIVLLKNGEQSFFKF